MTSSFAEGRSVELDWRRLAEVAAGLAGTPSYVMAATGVRNSLSELARVTARVSARHWLSFKTQPVKPLMHLWRDWGGGVEVVSEYELIAALQAGFDARAILVNGVGKRVWLSQREIPHLNVHFDSISEVRQLRRQAEALAWRVGIRCQVPNQRDADGSAPSGQFGMSVNEAMEVAALLRVSTAPVRGIHFHIGTNIPRADEFLTAVEHVIDVCRAARLEPEYVDIGGGLPLPSERPGFDFERFADILAEIPKRLPTVRELWMENGRFLTARAAALVVSIIDRKERPDVVYLLCDGGRTNHALVAGRARHLLMSVPDRRGTERLTSVCGPTCMGSNRLGEWLLPDSLQPGDLLVWMHAGAYHLAWETRFSGGLAAVVWVDLNGTPTVARPRESPEYWWAAWT